MQLATLTKKNQTPSKILREILSRMMFRFHPQNIEIKLNLLIAKLLIRYNSALWKKKYHQQYESKKQFKLKKCR